MIRLIRFCLNCRAEFDAWLRYEDHVGEYGATVLEPSDYPTAQRKEIEQLMRYCSDACQVDYALKHGAPISMEDLVTRTLAERVAEDLDDELVNGDG